MRNVPVLLVLLAAGAAQVAHAQGSNGIYTITQDMVSSAGGQIGGGNPMQAQTVLGLPAAGAATNGTFTLVGGLTVTRVSVAASGGVTVTVTGTVDDSAATVTVNGAAATVSAGTFTAEISLPVGPSEILVAAADALGNAASVSVTVHVDLPAEAKTPRFDLLVEGTVDDATADVEVNGITAALANGQFSASVPITSGYNTLTATATDTAGNAATASVEIFVPPPTSAPPVPTVGTVGPPLPAVTTEASVAVGGTKAAGTSIWINGQQVVAADDQTTWTATLTLVEGDNELVIIAKDAAGNTSAPVTRNVVLDNLPPVIELSLPTQTNLTPYRLQGAVDDSLTVVMVNGLTADRAGRTFEVDIPLNPGANTVTVTAVSPNGFVTEENHQLALGTVPTLQSVTPADGAKAYADQPLLLSLVAVDEQGDPIECRFEVDGALLADWSPSATHAWTPGQAALGVHTLTLSVRDAYGGSNSTSLNVLVLREPVRHP